MHKIAVIGAGISGLGAAHYLQKYGYEVEVFEHAQSVGGRMRTARKDGYTWDMGAQFMVESYSYMKSLMKELGIDQEVTYVNPIQAMAIGNHEIFRFRSGSPLSFLNHPKLDFRAKLAVMKVLYLGFKHRNDLDFLYSDRLRLLDDGRDLSWWRTKTTDLLVDWILSVPTSTLFFWPEKETPWYSVFLSILETKKIWSIYTPIGGMGKVTEKLSSFLKVHLGAPVSSVHSEDNKQVRVTIQGESGQCNRYFDQVIIATPASIALNILNNPEQEIGRERVTFLEKTRYTVNLTTAIGYEKAPEEKAYGFAVPTILNSSLAAIGWDHLKGNDRAPLGKGIAIVMPTHEYSMKNWDRPEHETKKEVSCMVSDFYPGSEDNQTFMELYRWRHAMPITYPGWSRFLSEALHSKSPEEAKIFVCGDYWAGPTTEHALFSGYRAAQEVIKKNC